MEERVREPEQDSCLTPLPVEAQFDRSFWWQVVAAVAIFAAAFWYVSSTAQGREWSGYKQPPPVAALSLWQPPQFADAWHPPMAAPKSLSPAPTVKRGPDRKAKGKIMATYIVSGAGDSNYNGTYNESGTYNSHPAYTNGSCWLWYDSSGDVWILSASTGSAEAYYQVAPGSAPDIASWVTSTPTGTDPAPTVAEYEAPPDPHYAIEIDYPVEGQVVPGGSFYVTGRCTADPTPGLKILLTYQGDTSAVVDGSGLADWSFEVAYPDSWGGTEELTLTAQQTTEDGSVAASDSVGFEWVGDVAQSATAGLAEATAEGLPATTFKSTTAGLADATAEGLPATAALTLLEATETIADATAAGLSPTGELKPDQNVTAGIAEAVAAGITENGRGVVTFERSHSVIEWYMVRYKRGVA